MSAMTASETTAMRELIFGDLERELTVTRRVLAALPEDRFGWTPHEKSMSLARLAAHVADMPEWMRATLGQDELDAAEAPRPFEVESSAHLLEHFDANVERLRAIVAAFDVANFHRPWTIRSGEHVIATESRSKAYRVWCVNHMINHRGQLALYLRLLNVPVPIMYFNTADNLAMTFE